MGECYDKDNLNQSSIFNKYLNNIIIYQNNTKMGNKNIRKDM